MKTRTTAHAAGNRTWVAALGFLLFSASGYSQTVPAAPHQRCEQALSDRGARLAVPVLNSKAVREASCTCLAAAASRQDSTGVDARVRQCISQAAPAERPEPLPPAVLARLEEAFASNTAKSFVEPTANFSSCKPPEYPALSARVNASGATRLAFHIGANSKVLDGEVIKSAGSSAAHKLLDVTALFALMQCRFQAASWGGQPIEAWQEVEYQWRLE